MKEKVSSAEIVVKQLTQSLHGVMKENYKRANSAGKLLKEYESNDNLVRRKYDEQLRLENKKMSLPSEDIKILEEVGESVFDPLMKEFAQ